MSKVNFLDVYNYDSSTVELCNMTANSYKEAAKLALEESGNYLVAIRKTNPNIDIPWHFRSRKKSNDKSPLRLFGSNK
jgi:hypothetical protein